MVGLFALLNFTSGDFVGLLLGDFVGLLLGDFVGLLLGDFVGLLLGDFVEDFKDLDDDVGLAVAVVVGKPPSFDEGLGDVGVSVGVAVGVAVRGDVGVAVGVAVGDAVGEEVGFDEGLAEGLEDSEGLVEGDAEGPVDAEGLEVKITSPPTPLKAFHGRLGEHISVSASTPSRKRGNMIYEIHDLSTYKNKNMGTGSASTPNIRLAE